MKTYKVCLTREITESVFIKVQAENEFEAEDKAQSQVPDTGWKLDDGATPSGPYVSDIWEE